MNGPTNRNLQTDLNASIVRPFTLQEALPYSPQTSTVPFVPGKSMLRAVPAFGRRLTQVDIIPDPSLGSGSAALSVTNLFPRDEYESINQEGLSQGPSSKMVKQAADFVLQDVRSSNRTQ